MLGAKRNDTFNRCIQTLEHEGCGNSQDREPARAQKGIAALVAVRSGAHVVGLSIDLDCDALLKTGEIEHQFAERVLTPEFEATGSFAQLAPNENFREIARPPFAFRNAESLV